MGFLSSLKDGGPMVVSLLVFVHFAGINVQIAQHAHQEGRLIETSFFECRPHGRIEPVIGGRKGRSVDVLFTTFLCCCLESDTSSVTVMRGSATTMGGLGISMREEGRRRSKREGVLQLVDTTNKNKNGSKYVYLYGTMNPHCVRRNEIRTRQVLKVAYDRECNCKARIEKRNECLMNDDV
mmetsp:Transcript_66949/g.187126  ORF Transcript_66949/g.187126 Transcript_66949/m.187126 type:complete len:181 (-) Transcript_66949:2-544(-)